MTSKKKRSRGSRTHGGGSQKNRRGAGHRGGRGRAGRDKHEHHNYEPLGKHGFTRPESEQRTVETVGIQSIDEDVALLVADGVAEETADGYAVDVRDVVDTGEDVNAVKVLANGQVRNTLEITADEFSDAAMEAIESAGGTAIVSERGQEESDEQSGDDTTDEQ